MGYSVIPRQIKADICYGYYNSSATISVGYVVPYNTFVDLIGTSASSYSSNAGLITFPVGYWYIIYGSIQCNFANGGTAGNAKYRWKDELDNNIGRRGTQIMQEYPHVTGGDELAVVLIDATTSQKKAKLVIEHEYYQTVLNSTSNQNLAGKSRVEIWRI